MEWYKKIVKCFFKGIHKKNVSDGVCIRCGAKTRASQSDI